jgi:hypothetical protein
MILEFQQSRATDKGVNMNCKKDQNLKNCNCSYAPCSRKGICCECIRYHLQMRELPACAFPDKAEATFDRSFEHFAQLVITGKA